MTDTAERFTRKPVGKALPIALAVVVVLALFAWLALPRLRPHEFSGTVIQSPLPATDFTLTSAGGPVSLSDFRGKVVLLYFGYTFCPDVCPTTLSDVNRALQQLGNDADDVQLIMVSVDPARDTPDKLAEYVPFFNSNFVGVTGTEEQIAEVATLWNVWYQKEEGTEATGYLVSHTATLFVVDRDGHLKLLIPYGVEAEATAADLAYILR